MRRSIKILTSILLLLLIFVGTFTFYDYQHDFKILRSFNQFLPNIQPVESEPLDTQVDTDNSDESEETNDLVETIEEFNEVLDDLEQIDDASEEETVATKKIPASLSVYQPKLYQNPFIRFTYPNFMGFTDETLNFLTIINLETKVKLGTLNIYNNIDGLTLEEFLQQDNLVNYFQESLQRGISVQAFEVTTAERAVKFSQFPELTLTDIYLVSFDKLIILVKDFSGKNLIGEHIVKSLEKSPQ